MSEENKALVRRIVDEDWNQGNLAVVDEAFAPDYLEHNPRPGQEPGVDGYKGGIVMMRAAFPDLFLEVHDMIAEGDRVAILYALHGTHDGQLMGIPASGQRVSSEGMVLARFRDGRVIERWGVQDMLTLLQQIGAFATASATG